MVMSKGERYFILRMLAATSHPFIETPILTRSTLWQKLQVSDPKTARALPFVAQGHQVDVKSLFVDEVRSLSCSSASLLLRRWFEVACVHGKKKRDSSHRQTTHEQLIEELFPSQSYEEKQINKERNVIPVLMRNALQPQI